MQQRFISSSCGVQRGVGSSPSPHSRTFSVALQVIEAEQRGLKETHQLITSLPFSGGDPHHVYLRSLGRINHINLVPIQTVSGGGVLESVGEHTEFGSSTAHLCHSSSLESSVTAVILHLFTNSSDDILSLSLGCEPARAGIVCVLVHWSSSECLCAVGVP